MNKIIDFGPIKKLLDDPAISEIMINGPEKVFVEKKGMKSASDVVFKNKEELDNLIVNIFDVQKRRLDQDVPFADVCLEDGTRINAIIPPLARFGTAVTLRKFSQEINTLADLVKLGMLNQKAADLLVACIKGRINIILSGGTGVGKTTLLQILSQYFFAEERIITIEDAAELHISKENVISLETRHPDINGKGEVTLRDLIRNALRMSPDRLIFGEIRGVEAIDMLQAMATGHAGSIGIIHGNSPKEAIARLESLVLMLGLSLSPVEVRKIIATTINLIVHMERFHDGVRRITYITEIRDIKGEEIIFNDLFTFQAEGRLVGGPVVGQLKSALKYYPLFFPRFEKDGLVTGQTFVNDK
jgi:pilus assembly protein CpaF